MNVTVTVVRKCAGLKEESKHYTLRVLYYAMVTAQSCEHFPLLSILLATQNLSVRVQSSTPYLIQVGGVYPLAVVQHPSITRGNRHTAYGVSLLTILLGQY